MRMLMISPELPPGRGGVSDHSAQIAIEATRQDCQVELLTYRADPAPIPSVTIHTLQRGYSALAKWTGHSQPDCVLVQYTPLSFAPTSYGIAAWLPLALWRLRRAGHSPLLLFAHESHYPVRLSAIGLLIGLPQFLQFFALAALADKVLFSHQASRNFWARRLPWKKMKLLVAPVPSNIPVADPQPGIRGKFSLPPAAPLLLYFGGAHDMNLVDYVVDAHQELCRTNPRDDIRLVMAGISAGEVMRKTNRPLPANVVVTGYLPANELSALYQEARLVLAPFGEGINTRRGSAMAALAHGKALVTTRGWCTGTDYPWPTFVALAESRDEFVSTVTSLYSDHERARTLGSAARETYDRFFSGVVATSAILDAAFPNLDR